MNRTRIRSLLAMLVATLVFAGSAANAQVKPFKVTGGGSGPRGVSLIGADSPHSATGNATHVGKYSGDGVFNSLSFDFATLSGTFHGAFTFVAKNGDKLAFTYGDTTNGAEQAGIYQGYLTDDGLIYVVFVAEFNPIPSQCTGKFKTVVDGSFIMVAVSEPFPLEIDENFFTPPFDYTWEGEGWIEFKKK